jgi:hypothetical protein
LPVPSQIEEASTPQSTGGVVAQPLVTMQNKNRPMVFLFIVVVFPDSPLVEAFLPIIQKSGPGI